MKGFRFSGCAGAAKKLKCFSFRRRSEGEETQVWLAPARLHHLVENVFLIRFVFAIRRLNLRAENCFKLACGLTGLTGVGFIDNHCVFSTRDRLLPLACGFLFIFGRVLGAFRASDVQ